MKKCLCLILVAILLCSVVMLVACNDETEPTEYHTIKIICNANVTKTIKVKDGEVIGDFTKTTNLSDKFVARWSYYTDSTFTKEWDLFRDKVYTDMTLYGKPIQ